MIWEPVRKWLEMAVPAGTPVILRDQDGKKPAESFVAAKLIAEAREGHPYIGELRDDGTVLIQQGALMTVSVHTYGPQAVQLAHSIRNSLNRITVLDRLRTDGFAYVDTLSGPTDMAEVVGTTFEQRGHLDVQLRVNIALIDDVGIIEVVQMHGDIQDQHFDMLVGTRPHGIVSASFGALQVEVLVDAGGESFVRADFAALEAAVVAGYAQFTDAAVEAVFGVLQASGAANILIAAEAEASFGALMAEVVAQQGFEADVAAEFGVFQASVVSTLTVVPTVDATFAPLEIAVTTALANPATVEATFAPLQAAVSAWWGYEAGVEASFGPLEAEVIAEVLHVAVSATFEPLEAAVVAGSAYQAAVAASFEPLGIVVAASIANPAAVSAEFAPLEAAITVGTGEMAEVAASFGALEIWSEVSVELIARSSVEADFGVLEATVAAEAAVVASAEVSVVFEALEAAVVVPTPYIPAVVTGAFEALEAEVAASSVAPNIAVVSASFAPLEAEVSAGLVFEAEVAAMFGALQAAVEASIPGSPPEFIWAWDGNRQVDVGTDTIQLDGEGIEEGDLLITFGICVNNNSLPVLESSLGETEIGSGFTSNNSGMRIWWRYAEEDDPMFGDVSNELSVMRVGVFVWRYPGARPVNPIGDFANATTPANTTNTPWPGLDLGGRESNVVTFGLSRANQTMTIRSDAIDTFVQASGGNRFARGRSDGPVDEWPLAITASGGNSEKNLFALEILTGEMAPPLDLDFDAVVVVGASITRDAFGDNLSTPHTAATNDLAAAGVPGIPVYGWGFVGADAADMVTRIGEARAAHPDALIIVDIGGNYVNALRPYADADEGDLEDMRDDYEAMFDAADAHFGLIHFATISWRIYDDPEGPARSAMLTNPEEGAGPFNDEEVIPMIADRFPYTIADGRPIFDFYRWGKLADYEENIFGEDGRHHNSYGNEQLRLFVAQRVAQIAKEEPTPAYRELGGDQANLPASTPWIVVSFGNNTVGGNANSIIVGAPFVAPLNSTPIALDDLDGEDSGVTIALTPSGSAHGGIGANSMNNTTATILGGPASFTDSIYCEPVLQANLYMGAPATVTIDLAGLGASTDYVIWFAGSRTPTELLRRGVLGNADAEVFIDHLSDPPQLKGNVFRSSPTGTLQLVVDSLPGGSAYAHIAGMGIEKLEEE